MRTAIVHCMLLDIDSDASDWKWSLYSEVIDEFAELGADLALSTLSDDMFCMASGCTGRSRQLLWRCKCGTFRGCGQSQCEAKRSDRTICTTCFRFGTINLEEE